MRPVDLFFIFTSALFIAFSGALIPGPMLTVTVKEALLQGWRAGPYVVAGHGAAELGLLGLFAAGLNRVLAAWWITAGVGLFGGLVLLLFGLDTVRGAWRGSFSLEEAARGARPAGSGGPSFWRPFKAGVLVSVANPTWVLWWFSVGLLYVSAALRQGVPGLVSFYAGHILADLAWYAFAAFVVATGRRFLTPGAYRGILAACGVFLVGVACYFLVLGGRALAAHLV